MVLLLVDYLVLFWLYRNFWRRHKRKILITAGVLGSGYFICKLYNAHQQKLADLERELARQRANDEIIKAQLRKFDYVFVFLSPPLVYDVLWVLMLCLMTYIFRLQGHFENVQLIADTTSLPHAMQYLRARIVEVLDLSQLTERLQKGKGQPTTLTPSEKFELWDRLKILRMQLIIFSAYLPCIQYIYSLRFCFYIHCITLNEISWTCFLQVSHKCWFRSGLWQCLPYTSKFK